MTNDIASELSLLHTLKGAAYVSKLMEIAARKEFHPQEDDPCIFSVGGEKDEDYPNLLNAARKAVEHGYQVYDICFSRPYAKSGLLSDIHEMLCKMKKSCRSNS